MVTGNILVPVACEDGSVPAGSPIVVPISMNFTVPGGYTGWWRTGDQNNVLSWINAVQAPNLCAGIGSGEMKNSPQGATFDATINAGPHDGTIDFQWHYRIPAAKRKPNTNCLDTADPNRAKADVCGASWSSTKDP